MPSPATIPSEEHATLVAKDPKRLALAWRAASETPLVELADEPVTIGAGPRCAIRLTDAGLRPLHCVVLPTEGGPRVRRWAPESLLNGEAFEEASLACGDQLSLGTVELLVVDLDRESNPAAQNEGTGPDAAVALDGPLLTPNSSEIAAAPTEKETVEADSIDLATLAGNEWAIPSDYGSAVSPIEEGIAESVRAWSEALPATPESETLASLTSTSDQEAEIKRLHEQLDTALVTADQSLSKAERFNRRQKSHRRRAQHLIEALRGRAADADLLRRAIDERDETMAELQARLDSALAAGEAASLEIAEMQATHAQDFETHTQRVEADYSAQLAELTALSAAPPILDEIDEVATAPIEPTELAEPSRGVDPTPSEDDANAGALWSEISNQQPAEPPATEIEVETGAHRTGMAEGTADWGIEASPNQAAAEEEPPWGIEQIPVSEAATAQHESAPEEHSETAEPTEALQESLQGELSSELGIDWFAEEAAAQASAEESDEPVPVESPVEPQSFIEKYGHLLPDEDEGEGLDPVPVAAVEPEPEPVVEAEPGDDSIDDYMQRLMQRVRGESPAELDTPTLPKADSETIVGSAAAIEPQAEAAPKPIQDLSELSRSAAPEAATDMDALRQLANHSARSAIQVASKRESREHAAIQLIGSVAGIVVGALASMTAASQYGVQFIGGLVTVLGCGWYGVKTLGFFQRVTAAEELGEQPH